MPSGPEGGAWERQREGGAGREKHVACLSLKPLKGFLSSGNATQNSTAWYASPWYEYCSPNAAASSLVCLFVTSHARYR